MPSSMTSTCVTMPSCSSIATHTMVRQHRTSCRQIVQLCLVCREIRWCSTSSHDAAEKTFSESSPQLSAAPAGLQRHESLVTPTYRVPNADMQQPSLVKYTTQSAGLSAAHPAQKAPVKVSRQPGLVTTPEVCLKPNPKAGSGKISRALPAAEKRSPLKGSNAWPPASPSPKKGMHGCSQNRAPVRGNGSSVPAVRQQPDAEILALHHRLRSGLC